jgi:hypothetical protein
MKTHIFKPPNAPPKAIRGDAMDISKKKESSPADCVYVVGASGVKKQKNKCCYNGTQVVER